MYDHLWMAQNSRPCYNKYNIYPRANPNIVFGLYE